MTCHKNLVNGSVIIIGRKYKEKHRSSLNLIRTGTNIKKHQIDKINEIGKISVFQFCPELWKFKKRCMRRNLTSKIQFTKIMKQQIKKFADKMQDLYESEHDRQSKTQKQLEILFTQLELEVKGNISRTANVVHKMGVIRSDNCIYLGPAPINGKVPDDIVPEIIMEVKAEFGCKSKSDPVIQSCAYYKEFTYKYLEKGEKEQLLRKTSLPSLLMMILGRVICFYGAVSHFNPFKTPNGKEKRYILCDHLFSYHFDTGVPKDVMVNQVFNILYAMYKALEDLNKYRFEKVDKTQEDAYEEYHNASIITFPIATNEHFTKEHQLTKIESKLVWLNTSVVFKYADTYCQAAHQVACGYGIAPALKHFEVLPSGKVFIIMEKVIEDKSEPLEISKWNKFKEGFEKFSCEYVHGDIRDANLIYGKIKHDGESKFYLIDFDWSSPIASAGQYPLNINPQVFSPFKIESGDMISKENDKKMFNALEATLGFSTEQTPSVRLNEEIQLLKLSES